MMLVPNWRRLWKAFSVQCMSWAAILQLTWTGLDSDLKAALSPTMVSTITIVLLVLGVAGRLVRQPGVDLDNGSEADSSRH